LFDIKDIKNKSKVFSIHFGYENCKYQFNQVLNVDNSMRRTGMTKVSAENKLEE
jgi:hypothetical protein